MLIGEISNKTGLSRDTIRFYEKKKLIKVNRSDSEWNNYKHYSEQNLNTLFLIKNAKSFGFTLNEIGEILELFELNMANCSTMEIKVEDKIKKIEKKITELKAMKKMILEKIVTSQLTCDSELNNSNCKILSQKKTTRQHRV